MSKRFLAMLLLCIILPFSCTIPAHAANDNITIIIDLSNYSGEIDGTLGGNALIAGQINQFVVNASDYNSADFTLIDYSTEDYGSWTIEGTMGTASFDNTIHSINEYFVDDPDSSELVFYRRSDTHTVKQIQISYNHFVLNRVTGNILLKYWGAGTTLIFKPDIKSVDYPVKAESSDKSKGDTSVSLANNSDTYVLTATANDGFSFSYWLQKGFEDVSENQISNNPYVVTADTEITYVAYFRDRYSVNVVSEDVNKGTVSTEYIGAENGQDFFRLTAAPATYCKFSHWECGEESYSSNPLEIAVEDSNQSYVAYFTPIELDVSDDAFINISSSIINGFTTTVSSSTYGGIVSSGCRSTLYIPVTIPEAMENVTVRLQITDANDRVLADYSETRSFSKRSGYLTVSFDPTEANISTLVATVTLTTTAGSSTVNKTYSGLVVATGEANEAFSFVSSPKVEYDDVTVVSAGPNINGVYSFKDLATKGVNLYFYGPKGVYAFDAASTPNLNLLEGLSQEVLSLGPDGDAGLIAAVKASNTILTLFKWDGTSWTQVTGSALTVENDQSGLNCALVMAAEDIWTDTKHWDGDNWKDHSFGFVSFQRVSDTEAYGVDGSGSRWHYDGSSWTAASALSAPETSSVTSTSVNGSTVSLGQDHNGDWYLFVQSRNHFIDDSGWYSYDGSDVYKWDGSKWVYQIMSDFNDPNDDPMETRCRIRPDDVNALCVPAPGISVMYGTQGRGAIYLSADNVTITFNPGEGTLDNAALGTMTAPILSEIDSSKVPGASRDGYTFGGWFYDEACTIEFDASSTAMPGESITLYAKYSDGNDSEAQLAWYKQKALKDLEKQYKKYSSADYTSENWSALQSAYIDGVSAINAATAGTANIEENVTAALNAAIAAMQAIPPKDTSKVTVAVSMDANTLGLGYILEPTLVTVDKGTPVSVVITDLLSKQAQKKYDINEPGKTTKVDGETLSTLYPWISDGAPTAGFYLSQVYYPEQTGYTIPATIQEYITGNQLAFVAADANGKYLGEFDYLNTSGWTYSVGDKTNGAAEFPGIGSNGWGLSDGEVVRWQFTLVGYGADLGADNTAWGTSNILSVGDKSALTWKVAELRSQYSDTTLKTYDVYNDALAVLTNAEAEQGAIDAALADLNGLVIPVPQGPSIGNGSTEGTTENGVTTFAAGTAADAPTISVTAPEGGWTMDGTTVNSFTVSCENDAACVVLVKSADGSYTRLNAENAGTTHTFNTALNLGDELVVVVKGDIDGNGKLSGPEVTQIKAAQLGLLTTFTELQNLVADLDGNGKLSGPEVTQLKAAQLGLLTLTW